MFTSRVKRLLVNVLLLMSSVIFCLVIAEIVTRIIRPNDLRIPLMFRPALCNNAIFSISYNNPLILLKISYSMYSNSYEIPF